MMVLTMHTFRNEFTMCTEPIVCSVCTSMRPWKTRVWNRMRAFMANMTDAFDTNASVNVRNSAEFCGILRNGA